MGISKKDGGPAFPATWKNPDDENAEFGPDGQLVPPGDTHQITGMTLRQWYAGQAMIGVLANRDVINRPAVAKVAYELADAMLAEDARSESPPDPL